MDNIVAITTVICSIIGSIVVTGGVLTAAINQHWKTREEIRKEIIAITAANAEFRLKFQDQIHELDLRLQALGNEK